MKYLDHLMTYKKDTLYDYAKILGLKKISSLSKGILAERIKENVFEPANFYGRLSIFQDSVIDLIFKAKDGPYQIKNGIEQADAAFLQASTLADVSDKGILTLVDELKDCTIFEDPDFCEYRRNVVWLLKCMRTASYVYWLFDLNILSQIFNKNMSTKKTASDIKRMLGTIPEDFRFWDYSEDMDMFYTKSQLSLGDLKLLKEKQTNFSYYVLSPVEIEEYVESGFWKSHPSYEKLIDCMEELLQIPATLALEYSHEFSANICSGMDFIYVIKGFLAKIHFKNAEQVNSFIDNMMNAYNNTHMIRFRGNTPFDVVKRNPELSDMVTILGRREKDSILNALSPVLNSMGFKVDEIVKGNNLYKESIVKKIKIYPNAPCPCGSGKKYKKCCGR